MNEAMPSAASIKAVLSQLLGSLLLELAQLIQQIAVV